MGSGRPSGCLDRLEQWTNYLTAAMMAVLATLVGYQVFTRYVLNQGHFWVEELTGVMLMWIALIGAAGGVWTGSHMGLTLVLERMPARLKMWVQSLLDWLVGVFAGFLLLNGITLVKNTMHGTLSTLPVAVGYAYSVVPVSAALMMLFAFTRGVVRLIDGPQRKGQQP